LRGGDFDGIGGGRVSAGGDGRGDDLAYGLHDRGRGAGASGDPGSLQVARWIGGQSLGDKRATFRCRPLACPELSIVSIRTSASPTRSPDPQALQKFAQESAQREMTKAEEASAEGETGCGISRCSPPASPM